MSIVQEHAQSSSGVIETSAKTAEELLEFIPQEVAASPGLIKRKGEVTFVACRDFTDEDAERLESLTPREYETLLLAAECRVHRDIAADLDIALTTAKTHLNHAYEKLGVVGQARGQAATFIPMDVERIRLAFPDGTVENKAETVFDPIETAVIEALADGLTSWQIAQKLKFGSDSTTNNIRWRAGKKLGIQGKNGFVLLVRTAGALRNLHYCEATEGSDYKTAEPCASELPFSAGRYAAEAENRSAGSTNASGEEVYEELVGRLYDAQHSLAEADAVREQAIMNRDDAIYRLSEAGLRQRQISELSGISLGRVHIAVDEVRKRQQNLV